MRFLIVTGGSHGDVHPFLAVGRALVSRGHDVAVAVHPHFAPDLAAAGLTHISIGDSVDFDALLKDPDLMHRRKGGPRVLKMILEAAPANMEVVRNELRTGRYDAVLTHHVCFGIRWVCEEERVPCAVAVLAPIMWFSNSDPVPVFQRSPSEWRRRAASIVQRTVRPLMSVIGDIPLNRLRRRVGMPKQRGLFVEDFMGGDVNLGLWSSSFRGPTPHDPARGVICGFPWYDAGELDDALDPALERFLDGGEPPIVFTLGTAAVHSPGDYYEVATAAARDLGRRAVLLVGPGSPLAFGADGDRFVADYVPFSTLLRRGAATVHHGGIGSTGQAIRAGRPAVVIPHAHDQFHNALHVHRLGIARGVQRHHLDARRLAAALREVLDDPEVSRRAAALGEVVRAEPSGAEVASDQLERLGRSSDDD